MNISLSLVVALASTTVHSNDPSENAPRVEHAPTTTPLTVSLPLAPRDDNTIIWSWKDGVRFQTEDGRMKGKLGGRIQLDASAISTDDTPFGTTGKEGTEFRRARVFTQLDWDNWGVKAEYGFEGGDVNFKAVYMSRKDAVGSADLKIGHFKEPFSIGQLTSSKYLTFMERALPDVFAPARNIGIGLNDTWGDQAGTWATGIFRQDTGGDGMAMGEGNIALTARGTWTPVHNDDGTQIVHLGAAYSIRDNDMLRLQQRPELHLSDRFIDTGTLMTDDLDLGSLELAGVHGPFHGTIEYMMGDASGAGTQGDVDYSGYNVQLGYFLTGESRPYNRSSGAWDRVKPNSRWSKGSGKGAGKKGGQGAMETAIRFSSLDLDDGIGAARGTEDNISLAFNWYLTPNIRWGINYIMGDIDYVSGPDGDFTAIGTRLQVDW